ncbi:MAG: N-acetylmuramoyl-L-alanine amidase family protein [Bilifractor sp.]
MKFAKVLSVIGIVCIAGVSGSTLMPKAQASETEQAAVEWSGWDTVSGATVYRTQSGSLLTGIQMIDGKIYVFSNSGSLQKGMFTFGGNVYYADASGVCQTGFQKIGNATYYFSEIDGKRQTGWVTKDSKKYFFDRQTGALVHSVDHKTVDGHVYKFADDGSVVKDYGTVQQVNAQNGGTASTAASGSNSTAKTSTKTSTVTGGSGAVSSNQGSAGNVTIPSQGINTRLYSVSITNSSSQTIVNNQNSAAWLTGGAQPIIADHCNQNNFGKIQYCSGKVAYISKGNSVTRYVCTGVYHGQNTGYDIVFNGKSAITSHVGDLVMYTCNGNWQNVWVAVWKAA